MNQPNDAPQQKMYLQYKWEWLYKPRIAYSQQTESDWLSDYQKVFLFDTVETFWKMYNNIPSWHDLSCGSIYALFKKDIKPSWEDDLNVGGFSWILYVSQRLPEQAAKDLYLNIILMLVGNTFDYGILLNGCTFEKKSRGDKIVFWFRKNNSATLENIVIDTRGLLKSLLKQLEIDDKDSYIVGTEDKIEWKSQELRHKKIAIRLIHHDNTIQNKTS